MTKKSRIAICAVFVILGVAIFLVLTGPPEKRTKVSCRQEAVKQFQIVRDCSKKNTITDVLIDDGINITHLT